MKKNVLGKILTTLENSSPSGNSVSGMLPHGIVLSQKAAENLIDFVYYVEGYRGARLAAGPCICQLATKRYPQGETKPQIKDITLFYASDIYEDLPMGHHEVTADEAKAIVADMYAKGNVPIAYYMFGKRSGAFVLCNCGPESCEPIATTRNLGEGLFCGKGPEVCVRDPKMCLGAEKCGNCANRCPFGASRLVDGEIVFDVTKCMGCGLCTTTCKGGARHLSERGDYRYDKVLNKTLVLAGKYGRPRLDPVITKSAESKEAVTNEKK